MVIQLDDVDVAEAGCGVPIENLEWPFLGTRYGPSNAAGITAMPSCRR